jgi:hypothetical protein
MALRIAYTLTTRADTTPDQWRGYLKSLRMRFKRAGYAAIFRMEMHVSRWVPHCHLAAFIPTDPLHDHDEQERLVETVKWWWLEITGQDKDTEAKKRAVKWKAITSGGFAVYQALHDSKDKAAQATYPGKQWGVWNLEKFEKIPPDVVTLTPEQDRLFRRWMTLHLRKLGAKGWCPRTGTFMRMCTTDTIRAALSAVKERRPANRSPLLVFDSSQRPEDPF